MINTQAYIIYVTKISNICKVYSAIKVRTNILMMITLHTTSINIIGNTLTDNWLTMFLYYI